jgi:phenylalanyl-tRNA synthetase beta chain
VAAVGTHDLSVIKGPLYYQARSPDTISFVPLREDKEFTAIQLLKHFDQTDPTMAKYFTIIKDEKMWPLLCDSTGAVLSLIPIVNSKYSQITIDTTDILVEVSSAKGIAVCKEISNAFLGIVSKFLPEKGDQLVIEQVKVVSEEDGHTRVTYPSPTDLEDVCKD